MSTALKSERREQQRRKRQYGMRVDGAQVRRVQLALLQRHKTERKIVS